MIKNKINNELEQPLEKPFKADLHVHTPASRDFHLKKTDKIEEEYLAILKMAKRQKVSILGITDHCSIDGYIKFLRIKQGLDNELHADVPPEQKKSIEKKIKLFENIFIIPGVELKTRDGVEYIILFDPDNPVKRIQSFISNLDFDMSHDIVETPSTDLTKRAKKFGGINIAAHVDSDKGVYNTTISNPTMRMSLFKDPSLDGMHFNSSVTRDKIESYLQDPHYRREDTLTFIKCSDFHNRPGEKVGKEAAYFKLSKRNFPELVKAFQNPIERVSSPATFDINRILDTLLSKENKLCIESLGNSTKTQFLQYASAYSNSDGGYILIGISDKKNIKGIEETNIPSVLKCLVKFLMNELDPRLFPLPDVTPYTYGQKIVFSIFFPRYDDSIVLVKSEHSAYELRQNKPVVASSAAIMNIVIQKVRLECLTHLESNRSLKEKLVSDIKGIEDSLIIYPLFKKVVMDGRSLLYFDHNPSIVPPSDLTVGFKRKTSQYPNGNPTGTTLILEHTKPRYEDIILRYSAATYRGKNISGTKEENSFEKGCMVLYGGAVHVLNHSVRRVIPTLEVGEFAVIVKVRSSLQKTWPTEYIMAFLKSSPFLWYAWEKYREFNLVKRQTFLDLRIPSVDKGTRFRIATLVRDLCEYEKSYLRAANKIEKEQSKRISKEQKKELHEKIRNLTDSCNSKIAETSSKIDKLLYEKLNINEEEQEIIKGTLERQDLYVTGSSTRKQ